MKAKELRGLNPEQLKAKAEELRGEIERAREARNQGKEKNVNLFSALRHELARILTIISENEKNTHSSNEKL